MKTILYFFAAVAAVGLALSVVSHAAALLGIQGPLGDFTPMLHIGIFVRVASYSVGSESLHENASQRTSGRLPFGVSKLDEIHDLRLLWVCPIELSALYHRGPQRRRSHGRCRLQVVRGFLRTMDGLLLRGLGRLVLCREFWDQDWEYIARTGTQVQPTREVLRSMWTTHYREVGSKATVQPLGQKSRGDAPPKTLRCRNKCSFWKPTKVRKGGMSDSEKCPFTVGDVVVYRPSERGRGQGVMTDFARLMVVGRSGVR